MVGVVRRGEVAKRFVKPRRTWALPPSKRIAVVMLLRREPIWRRKSGISVERARKTWSSRDSVEFEIWRRGWAKWSTMLSLGEGLVDVVVRKRGKGKGVGGGGRRT